MTTRWGSSCDRTCQIASSVMFVLFVVLLFAIATGAGLDPEDKPPPTVTTRNDEEFCGMTVRDEHGIVGVAYRQGNLETPIACLWPEEQSKQPYSLFFDETTGEPTLHIPINNGHDVRRVSLERVSRLILAAEKAECK